MKKALVLMIAFAAWAADMAQAQEAPYKFDLGGGLGMSGYLGDANNSSLLKHPGFTVEAGMRYLPNVRWAFRGVLGYTTLSGNTADMENYLPGGAEYSFSASVFSLDLRAEFNFLPYGIGETYKKLSRWTPYLVLGTGFCISSASGSSAGAATFPMGAGVKYKLKPRLNLAAEFTMTKVLGDKLDGPDLHDLAGIKTSFIKNTDWFSRLTIGITYEFGERCQTCHYVD
ncbi:MAG: porin family protein [Bacteroidales bacterium]|nr:porin family protein [Bacteroidales bacterium]